MRQVRGRSFRFPENRSKIGRSAENRSTSLRPAQNPFRYRKTFSRTAKRSKAGPSAENRSTRPRPAEKSPRTRKNVQPHGETLKNRVIRGKTFKSPHLDPPERICSARSTHRHPSFGAATISPTVVIWTTSLRWLQISPHATTVPPPGWARDGMISTCSTSPGRVGRGIRARHCVQPDLRLWAGRRRRETAVRERCASRWRQAGIMPSPPMGGPSKGLRRARCSR